MKRNIIIPKDHADWLEERKHGIGSSEVGTLLGLNKYETPYQLWARKLGMLEPEPENEAMLMGHLLEDAVAQRWALETGRQIIKASADEWIYYNPEKPYFRASPDRIYWNAEDKQNEQNKRVLECKTTVLDIDKDSIPQTWFCQVQWLMYCTGYRNASLAWINLGKREFGYKDISYDADFCQWLASEAEKFWQCLQTATEPELKNVKDTVMRFPKEISGKTIPATDIISVGTEELTILNAYQELQQLKSNIGELETRKTELEDAIKMHMQDAEAVTVDVNGQARNIITWKAAKDSVKFDSTAFKRDHGDLYDQYTKTTAGSRRMLLKAI